MLPSGSMERTGARGGSSRRPIGSLAADAARTPEQGDVFETAVADASRQLMTLPPEAIERAIEIGLPVLGQGLGADRAVYLEATSAADAIESPPRFQPRFDWTPAAGVRPVAIDARPISLERCGVVGARLVCGQAQLVTSSRPGVSLADRLGASGGPAWSPGPVRLIVPCPGPEGLAGLFLIERVRKAGPPPSSSIARAEELGRSFAAFLERCRLCAHVERLNTLRCRDERMEMLGRMASSVTHDFNNLLTAILGYADLLEIELEAGSTGLEELSEIRVAATRAAELVDEVLRFGRERTSGQRSVVLDELLSDWEGLIRRVLGGDHSLSLELESRSSTADREAHAEAMIRVDPGRLERAVLNLVANARDAIEDRREAGELSIATRCIRVDANGCDRLDASPRSRPIRGLAEGDYLRLSLRDDGCGIPAELHERIFEPFFTTRAANAGTGLGLALTAEVVRESSGGIRVESVLGEGTTFHLYFPISKTADREFSHQVGAIRNRFDSGTLGV